MRSTRLRFKELAERITGISIPIFGVSWNPPESERKIVHETLIFLEDRRALFSDFAYEFDHEVSQSVLQIRSELTSACREYLDNAHARGYSGHFSFMTELGKLRAMFGVQIAYLSVKFGIDLEGELARIIPPELRDARLLED